MSLPLLNFYYCNGFFDSHFIANFAALENPAQRLAVVLVALSLLVGSLQAVRERGWTLT